MVGIFHGYVSHNQMVSMANCYTARLPCENPPVRPLSIPTDWLSSAMRFCARPCSRLTLPTPMKLILEDVFFTCAVLRHVFPGWWYTYPSEKTVRWDYEMIKHVPNHRTSWSPLLTKFFYPCDISKVSACWSQSFPHLLGLATRLSKRMRFASVTAAVLAKRSTCGELLWQAMGSWGESSPTGSWCNDML